MRILGNEEKENISFAPCCRYIPWLFEKEKINSKFEELKKRRIEKDWQHFQELKNDLDTHEYPKEDFEEFLKRPYRFYRNDDNEWMNGYNAKPKNYEEL